MNEVENHYAGASQHEHVPKTGAKSSKPSSPAEVAKAALDQATSTAKKSLSAARDATSTASSWATDQYGSASRRVSEAGRRSAASLSTGRDGVQQFVEDNPVMVGVVGIAAGLLLGSLLPGTRRENQVFGRYADEVKDQGLRYARDLAEQGKHFVEDNLDAAARTGSSDAGRGQA